MRPLNWTTFAKNLFVGAQLPIGVITAVENGFIAVAGWPCLFKEQPVPCSCEVRLWQTGIPSPSA